MVQLTDEQKKIVEAPLDINVHVNATCGAGKTTTMIHRIAYMIKKCGVPAKSIAMFTYNRSLGIDMSHKLDKLGINSGDLFWCGTLHAFCYRFTQDYQDLNLWIQKFKGNKPTYSANGFRISYDPAQSLKYIIFDEYQDSDTEIAETISILSKNCRLMIVGDSRQQLYAYRGANIQNLLKVKDDFVEYTLSETFRCNKEICKLLNGIWKEDNIIRSNINGPKPVLYRSRGSSMNNPNITNEIVRLVNFHKTGSIAIISPTVASDTSRRFLNDIHSNILDKCHINFDCRANSDINHRKESKYIISSIHESKGLEYDTVILLNAIDNKYFFDYPSYEAQCKLFVACSRARQNLIIFEHNYHFSNGSIKWISENEHLFNKPSDEIWNAPIKTRHEYGDNSKIEKSCRDFIKGLTTEQKRALTQDYSPSKLTKSESGLGSHVGEPSLCGQLIEIMAASRLKFDIDFEFKPYLTAAEWSHIVYKLEIPNSVQTKMRKVYPHKHLTMSRSVDNGKVKLLVLYINGNKVRKFQQRKITDLEELFELKEVTENHVISDFMCNEYYKHLTLAHEIKTQLAESDSHDKEYVENIWWMLRFLKLMDMSLVGFNQDDLTKDEIDRVLNYISQSRIISDLTIVDYHSTYRSQVNLPGLINETWVRGEVDFECKDGFLEFKCLSNNDLEEAWLQVTVYNLISGQKHNKVYVYNALNGNLYERTLKC